MDKKSILEIVALFILFAIVVIPGVLYVDVIAHELYHAYKHPKYAKEICMDLNAPYDAHVSLVLPEDAAKIPEEVLEAEEKSADRIGKTASIIYLINALVVINWIFLIMIRRRRQS